MEHRPINMGRLKLIAVGALTYFQHPGWERRNQLRRTSLKSKSPASHSTYGKYATRDHLPVLAKRDNRRMAAVPDPQGNSSLQALHA